MKILMGTSVRKEPAILRLYLESLKRLSVPEEASIERHFIADTVDEDQIELLRRAGTYEIPDDAGAGGYDDGSEITHVWEKRAFMRVARNRDRLIERAISTKADFWFHADADVLLPEYTLTRLLAHGKDIVFPVIWSRWFPHFDLTPQVWCQDPGRLWTEQVTTAEFLKLCRGTELFELMGGGGGVGLISRRAMEAGIRFTREDGANGPPKGASWDFEDRQFCYQAKKKGFKLYADPTISCCHVYRPSDLSAGIKYMRAPLLC